MNDYADRSTLHWLALSGSIDWPTVWSHACDLHTAVRFVNHVLFLELGQPYVRLGNHDNCWTVWTNMCCGINYAVTSTGFWKILRPVRLSVHRWDNQHDRSSGFTNRMTRNMFWSCEMDEKKFQVLHILLSWVRAFIGLWDEWNTLRPPKIRQSIVEGTSRFWFRAIRKIFFQLLDQKFFSCSTRAQTIQGHEG